MGRRAAPYTVYPDARTGIAWLNTTINKARVRRPLGIDFGDLPNGRSQEHVRRVAEAAAKAYAALVTGRSLNPEPTARVQTASTLHELLSLFLVADGRTYPASAGLSVTHASHWEAFAADAFKGFAGKDATSRWKGDRRTPLERLSAEEGPTDYAKERMRVVLKQTVIKEVTTLFRFFEWAAEHRHITDIPRRPKYGKKALGVRSGTQRAAPVQTTHDETLAIIEALPEWASRGGRGSGKRTPKAIPVRDLARLAYETGLRPSTIARLSVPEHYSKGERRLYITPQIDKGRNGARWVPLSSVARAILERHAKPGTIFGRHDLRTQWKKAAASVLPPAKAKDFSVYDFRHGAGRRMVQVSGGNLLGVAHQLGHSQLTTTNRYLAPAEDHGEAIVAAQEAALLASRKPKRGRAAKTAKPSARGSRARIPSADSSARKSARSAAPPSNKASAKEGT